MKAKRLARWMLLAWCLTLCVSCGGDDDDSAQSGTGDDDNTTDDDADDDNDGADDDNDDVDDDDDSGDDDGADDDSDDDDDNDDNDDAFSCDVNNSDSTVGLLYCQTGASEGYTLLAPTMSTKVYLVDMLGYVVNQWDGTYLPGQVVYFLETGQLLRTGNVLNASFAGGGIGGQVMLQEWDGTVTWSYRRSSATYCTHHDVRMMPSGNVLVIQWEKKSQSAAIQAGRKSGLVNQQGMWPDAILELEPVGSSDANIVWEWHAWDHLIQDNDSSKDNYGVVGDHPELIDINYSTHVDPDFMHSNTVDYNEDFDQILISVRNYSEIWVIDHSTTTAEAAGHSGGDRGNGGDLLYRWGNPAVYDAGSSADRVFFQQHDAEWVKAGLPGAGHITIFNNGVQRPAGQYSSVDEIVPEVDEYGDYSAPGPSYGPDELDWTYTASPATTMFAQTMGGAHRLPNGNTLICNPQQGAIREVNDSGDVLWAYVNPVTAQGIMDQGEEIPPGIGGAGNEMFRAYRYPPDFAGFAGQDLTPGDCLVAPCD